MRCTGEGGSTVEQCRVAPASECTRWQTVEDCEDGACLGDLLDGACDIQQDTARCDAAGLVVCEQGPSGCPVWQPPTEAMLTGGEVDIDEGETEFTGYGVLELKLTSNVDAADVVACLTDTRASATAADSPAVTDVTASGGGSYELELSRYQLPVSYELTVAVGSPPAVRTAVLAPDEKSRVAFITTTKGDGDMKSWPNAVSSDPLVAADEACTAEANAAGLSGTYTAFLSANTVDEVDAVCRLRGANDVLSSGCGVTLSDDQLNAPYLDMRGMPVVYGTADIEAGLWRLPIGYTSTGQKSPQGAIAWTGSTMFGVYASSDCEGWNDSDSGVKGNGAGNPGVAPPSDTYSLACDRSNSLLCFSAGEGHPLAHGHERNGKRAFIVELEPNSDVSLETADAACTQASGESASVAWFSDEDDDALCRLAGLSGKVEDNCGEATPPVVEGPWVRSDGYLIAESLGDLVESPAAPLMLDIAGNYSAPNGLDEAVRTDTIEEGIRGFIGPSTECINGDRTRTGGGWTYFADGCPTNYRPFVYCFEK